MVARRMISKNLIEDDNFIFMSSDAKYSLFILYILANTRGIIEHNKSIARAYDISSEAISELKEHGYIRDDAGVRIASKYWGMQFSDTANSTEWAKIRLIVFNRDNYICAYCNDKVNNPECDHIYPKSLGGSDDISNLTTSCKKCNRAKGNKTIKEWVK